MARNWFASDPAGDPEDQDHEDFLAARERRTNPHTGDRAVAGSRTAHFAAGSQSGKYAPGDMLSRLPGWNSDELPAF